jgi:cellulose synthase/poly-beta-1,6-N-acetylglucosamine synthase-like glycosyltransferase
MTVTISNPGIANLRTSEARRPGYVRQTAERTLTSGQRAVGAAAGAAFVACLAVDTLLALRVLVVAVLSFSAAHLSLRCLLVASATRRRFPPRSVVATEDLPMYTTLHPMYDEANMIPVVVAAMEALDYPKDRLQCLLVLEERDRSTVEAARSYPLPDYFQIVETPTARPYGKPKACNHALQFATGEFVVIFDAEDRPDPQQLRRAVETFRAAEERREPLGCVQARLVFDNQTPVKGPLGEVIRDRDGYDVRPTTWCSRLLGNEYIVHFTLVLPGLAHLGLPVPLGGTSNHFPLAVLRDVAFEPELMPELPGDDRTTGAWDPWNVTEDAELGGAIAAHGYTTCVFDSHTDEEAVLTPLAAVNQRSRWVKGYAQTSLVLLRRPIHNMRAMGPLSFAAYQLQVGGAYLSLLIMPLTWALTATFIVTRSSFIIELFPGPLLYLGVLLTVGSNIMLVSTSLVAALRERQFGAVRHLLFLTPLWWLLLSIATWIATLELVFPRWRPTWNKTAHGVRYATRRRVWWLAFQRWASAWDARPTHRRRRIAPVRPALAPSNRAGATGPTHDQLFPRRSADERAEAARRAVDARRGSAKPPGPARKAISDRRAATLALRQAALRAASEAPPRPSGFGSGTPR